MKLKAVVDNLEKIDEKYHDLYTEQDGVYVLNVEPSEGMALENVEGLKETLNKVNKENRTLKRDLKKFDGLDPDEAKKALDKLDELGDLDPEKDAERIAQEKLEKGQEKLIAPFKEENQKLKDRNDKLLNSLQKSSIESAALRAVEQYGGSARLLMPHIRDRVKLVENDDGEFDIQVVDEGGDLRTKADREGKVHEMSVEDLVGEMRESEEFAPAFNGTAQSGGGTPPGGPKAGQRRGGVTRINRDASPRELGENLEDFAEGKAEFGE